MTLLSKLEQWVAEHPEEANEPFMNVTDQRIFTLEMLLASMQQEAQTGVAIVDEGLAELKSNVADWLA